MNMNAKTIAALVELEVSQIVDPHGFRHGFLVEVIRADQRDCEEIFFPTLAEAKAFYAEIVLTEKGDGVALYEGEFDLSYPWNDRLIPSRETTLIATRTATQKEIDWARAQEDLWRARSHASTKAYWDILDWLSGRTPAPEWPA